MRLMSTPPGASKLQARTRAVVRPFARRMWDIEQNGYERLPDDGPAILCPNHISFLDSAFLMLTVSVILANVLSDAVYPMLDPRVRRSGP